VSGLGSLSQGIRLHIEIGRKKGVEENQKYEK
jgi:hypothetical protein